MKATVFSKIIFVTTLLFMSFSIHAQENDGPRELKDKTYIIVDNGSISNIQPYIDAMNNSCMQYHRLKNKRYTIVFQTGVKVELFSAKEIISNGWKVNLIDYPEEFDSKRNEPVFALGANNFIIEYHKAANIKTN